ncbi:prepilin-type N-terminal cleavage/methylation domain-containing protein [Candidatus Gottesmanbacteria bacterium]|nr:prepilin-type N-terminal cleavage/methylation domain-containing protein [Candidatus Gottesmanbacteria bacterium]
MKSQKSKVKSQKDEKSPRGWPNGLPRGGGKKIQVGFTLLEVLVVIAIIAILITIGIASFSTVQKKGRDSKRKSDLKEVQTALEQYYSVCGYNYPVPTGFYTQGIICSSPSIAIMPAPPSDPRVVTPYYCSACNSTSYTICAQLESEPTPQYCLSNQQ